ncbi:MAG: hypothetical protein WA061_05220 [Microgenomates group bacterium]
MRKKEIDTIYLSMGGFLLRVDFVKHDDPEIVGINNLRGQIERLFNAFIVTPKKNGHNFKIELIPQNVIYEQPNNRDAFMYFFKERGFALTSFAHISIGQFVFLILYALQKLLVNHGGFFFHGSAILTGECAMIFTGRPGSGKSTASRLLENEFPILADDSMIIRKQKGQFYMYQVPPIEKNKTIRRSPNKYKVSKIFFLQKSTVGATSLLSNDSEMFLKFFGEVWSQKKDVVTQKKLIIDIMDTLVKRKSLMLLKFPKRRNVLNKLIVQQAHAGPKQ